MVENSLEIRTNVRMAQWQSIIRECKESGMTVAEFCEDRNISWHAYYYWLRKIREFITQPQSSETECKLLFSSKSERTKIVLPNPDQLTLFDEVEQEAAPEPSEEATTVKAHKRKKQHTQKKLDLSKAERNVVVLDIPEKDRHCPACGSNELVPVGKEHVRDEVRIIPAKVIVDEIYRKVYKCKACENDEHVEFVKAPTPKPLVPNSPVTPSVMTATMLNKF